jgi:hypothetical protein
MAGRRGSECRVLGCKRPAVFQLYMPGGDVIDWWWQEPEGELVLWELWVCSEHGVLLADEIVDGWGCIDPGQAEGWRLVVQFVASPEATNPLVLYPPGTVEQPGEVLAPVRARE